MLVNRHQMCRLISPDTQQREQAVRVETARNPNCTRHCSDLDNATPSRPLRFLGVDIFEVNGEYGIQGYALSQEGYIDELLRSHGLQASARAIVPLPRDWIREQPPEERDYPEATLREAQKITGGTALALPAQSSGHRL